MSQCVTRGLSQNKNEVAVVQEGITLQPFLIVRSNYLDSVAALKVEQRWVDCSQADETVSSLGCQFPTQR